MKTMYEQMDIFSFLPHGDGEEQYCFDSDINEIHTRLECIAGKYGLPVCRDEFTVWEHIPHLGYRMDFGMEVTRDILENANFLEDVDDTVEFSKTRKIELSPMWGGIFFYREDKAAVLSFYSTFMDRERQKIK